MSSIVSIPATWAYRAAIGWRNKRYDRGKGVERIDRPVISVGNITVGGTGKTPMVAAIVDMLLEAGHHPVIAMRGYGASDGQMSDEESELVDQFSQVPVIANPDRVSTLREFFADPANDQYDCVVLDDGFQHRQLHRDVDLVLIDATQNTFQDSILPAGRLREPLDNLSRADAVIVTRSNEVNSTLSYTIKKYHNRLPLAWARHTWTGVQIFGPDARQGTTTWFDKKRVVTMTGVGNPKAVEEQISDAGAMVRRKFPVRDHQKYDEEMLQPVREACSHPQIDGFVVTAKDWVKLRELIAWETWPVDVVVPQVKVEFIDGNDALRDLVFNMLEAFEPPEEFLADLPLDTPTPAVDDEEVEEVTKQLQALEDDDIAEALDELDDASSAVRTSSSNEEAA